MKFFCKLGLHKFLVTHNDTRFKRMKCIRCGKPKQELKNNSRCGELFGEVDLKK